MSPESEGSGQVVRREPENDPFACSICGHPLSTTKRVAGEDHCDGCLREFGVDDGR